MLTGRRSIFREKDNQYRKQGQMTKAGHQFFELARKRLSAIVHDVQGWKPRHVSDGDVFEYLGRGDDNTRAYLEARKDP